MKTKNRIDRYDLFPTSIWRASMIDALKKEEISLEDLEEGANEIKKTYKNINKSGRNSYQSGDLKFKETPEVIQKLLGLITYCVNAIYQQHWEDELIVLNTWLNINGLHSYNVRHTHPQALMAGVFYIKTTEKHPPLSVEEYDLNAFNRQSMGFLKDVYSQSEVVTTRHNFIPTVGDAYFFPAYVPHMVEENKTQEDRISISFNLVTRRLPYLNET
tara:strand:- start:216 stop:863 length:648 start_codon:yes stop_codon:yes gene_type:complete